MRFTSALPFILLISVGLASGACSSSDDSTGTAAAGGSGGGASSTNGGGSGGTSSGASLDMYCSSSDADRCMCIQDKNAVWGPNEGIKTCTNKSVGVGNGYCCAESNYPDSNTCTCQAWGCFEGSVCTCGIIYGDEPATSCAKAWKTCCVHAVGGEVSLCSCSNGDSCLDGDTQVSSCGINQARCGTGMLQLNSCSF